MIRTSKFVAIVVALVLIPAMAFSQTRKMAVSASAILGTGTTATCQFMTLTSYLGTNTPGQSLPNVGGSLAISEVAGSFAGFVTQVTLATQAGLGTADEIATGQFEASGSTQLVQATAEITITRSSPTLFAETIVIHNTGGGVLYSSGLVNLLRGYIILGQ